MTEVMDTLTLEKFQDGVAQAVGGEIAWNVLKGCPRMMVLNAYVDKHPPALEVLALADHAYAASSDAARRDRPRGGDRSPPYPRNDSASGTRGGNRGYPGRCSPPRVDLSGRTSPPLARYQSYSGRTSPPAASYQQRSSNICFNCGKAGHKADDCREPRQPRACDKWLKYGVCNKQNCPGSHFEALKSAQRDHPRFQMTCKFDRDGCDEEECPFHHENPKSRVLAPKARKSRDGDDSARGSSNQWRGAHLHRSSVDPTSVRSRQSWTNDDTPLVDPFADPFAEEDSRTPWLDPPPHSSGDRPFDDRFPSRNSGADSRGSGGGNRTTWGNGGGDGSGGWGADQ